MGFQAYWDVFEQTGSVKAYLEYARRGRMAEQYDDSDDDLWDDRERDEDEEDFIRG